MLSSNNPTKISFRRVFRVTLTMTVNTDEFFVDDDDNAVRSDPQQQVKPNETIGTKPTTTTSKKSVAYAGRGKTLEWRNVSMNITAKKKGDEIEKKILDNVWGSSNAGELSAIMGASGA